MSEDTPTATPAVSPPLKRAVILVPGFSKREKLAARHQLINSIHSYSDGYSTTESDHPQDSEAVQITAHSRKDGFDVTLDIYEAFWGDLIPDWGNESPWQRFKRGFSMIFYWGTGGLAKAVWHWRGPFKTLVALVISGLLLILWYLTVISVLVGAIVNDPSTLPPALTALQPEGSQWIQNFAGLIESWRHWPTVFFVVGLFSVGFLETLANMCTFVRSYLRDDALGEDRIGIRAKARTRVVDLLDSVYDGDEPYDEVHVIGHSLGSVIAVDALSEYGPELTRTTLHTWGSMLSLLILQEQLLERELSKVYGSKHKLANWIDIAFKSDVLASPRPHVRTIENDELTKNFYPKAFPDTLRRPRMPWHSVFSKFSTHESYYRSEVAMTKLVCPKE